MLLPENQRNILNFAVFAERVANSGVHSMLPSVWHPN